MRKITKFKRGDIVRYTAQFLRNTGQYTGNAINGLIVNPHIKSVKPLQDVFDSLPRLNPGVESARVDTNLYYVRWCDRPDTVLVHGANIEIDQRAMESRDRWNTSAREAAGDQKAREIARYKVERDLFEAGIIEDPDMDGGILG